MMWSAVGGIDHKMSEKEEEEMEEKKKEEEEKEDEEEIEEDIQHLVEQILTTNTAVTSSPHHTALYCIASLSTLY